jgi:glycosyltransferase involved in cell wall biosynthesis
MQIGDLIWLGSQILTIEPTDKIRVSIAYGLLNLPVALLASYRFRCPVILSLHNETELAVLDKHPILRSLTRRVTELWAVSESLESGLRQRFNLPVSYRPTGVDIRAFSNTSEPGRCHSRNIVYVGSFKWKKGVDDLLKAVAELAVRGVECRLQLIGSGALREEMEHLCEDLEIGSKVEFLGVLGQAEIAEVMNAGKVFALASLAEGRPKVVAEALATGLPCVVTETCNCSDLVEGAGIVVPAKSPTLLANALEAVLSEPEWPRLSARAQTNAERFSWERIGLLERSLLRRVES